MKFRDAIEEDALEIANIKVQGWQTTYRGIFPDDRLNSLNPLDKMDQTVEMIKNINCKDHKKMIVCEIDERVVGFAAVIIYHGEEREKYDSELTVIYIYPEYQRQGIGRELMRRVAQFLVNNGQKSLLIWVLEQSPNVVFYGRMGGRVLERTKYRKWGKKYPLVGFVWDEISSLL
ncbi:MAG: GNAT family N-acetyltransferase [Candidatus Heimdallarchaeota archaeon]|nr:GNAT family N-acetyltransferase [Candidatus Heimdallarchaeota archaeon]